VSDPQNQRQVVWILTCVEDFEKVESRVASILNVMTCIDNIKDKRLGGTAVPSILVDVPKPAGT
jgi:hypothetical protein